MSLQHSLIYRYFTYRGVSHIVTLHNVVYHTSWCITRLYLTYNGVSHIDCVSVAHFLSNALVAVAHLLSNAMDVVIHWLKYRFGCGMPTYLIMQWL